METRVVYHRDARLKGNEDVRHSVCGIRHILKEDGWTVEYYRCGAEWLGAYRAALVLTDTAADYRVVFDLGDSENTTKHWVRLELIRAAVCVGGLLEVDEDQDDDAPLVGVRPVPLDGAA